MRNFILGTDWWSDCDDTVALRLLCRSAKAGKIALKGVIVNACMDCSVASVDGFLVKEGMTDVAIGIDMDGTDFAGKDSTRYQKRLSAYAESYKTNSDAEDAVRLYRRLLAEADGPVEIVEIGFLQAVAGLLQSGPDDISELSGTELVKSKVKKFWIMAGKWDKDSWPEHNFANNHRSRRGGKIFCEMCPVPVTFLGFEIGHTVHTGGVLQEGDHLYDVLRDWGLPEGEGRSSWDPMTALLAVIGDEKAAGYDYICGRASVNEEDGSNDFIPCPDGPHKYVIKAESDSYYADMINDIIK